MEKKWNRVLADPIEAMRRRHSIRTYEETPLTPEQKERMQAFCRALKGPFPEKVRVEILEPDKVAGQKLGTYGTIKGAPAYLAAIVEEGPTGPEQLGFVFEHVVLYATSLGLGTCWLGGTFQKGSFSKAVGVGSGEKLLIVSPLGVPNQPPSQRQRRPFDELFFAGDTDTPLNAESAGELQKPLKMVQIAPSAVNGQPWRVIRREDGCHFYKKGSPMLTLFSGAMQRIDMGIGLNHFALAAEEKGLMGEICRLDRPDLNIKGLSYVASWVYC